MSFYIGIDGGASKTRGVLIDNLGRTLSKIVVDNGSNLKENQNEAPKILIDLAIDLCTNNSVSLTEVNAFGFGLASASYDNGREKLFKELDRIGISENSILINDAEAAYKVICQQDVGILVTVGTGIICIAKNEQGNILRTSGSGHEKDIGSGYWIGNQAFLKLALNESVIQFDNDYKEIYNIVLNKFNKDSLVEIIEYISESNDIIKHKASIAKDIIDISKHNNIALSIVQEATFHIAEEIINLNDSLDYELTNELNLFGNGSVIKSDIFRKSLNDSLSFNYSKINWFFSKLSSAYGSAMIAALSKDNIKINVKDLLNGDYLV